MEMKIITKRDVIRGSREKWVRHYKHYRDDYIVGWGDMLPAGEIRTKLAALNLETCTQKDVDDAIQAGSSWAALYCDICDKDVERLLRVGGEPDYEASWIDICADCLASLPKALEEK